MSETEFRTALHGVMTGTDQPPPMDPARVVAAARAARKRRQGVVAGAGAVVAVVAVTTTAVVLLPSGGSGREVALGAPSQTPPEVTKSATSVDGTAEPSSPEDGTAARLLDELTAARPAGHGAPTDLRSEPDGSGDTFPLRQHSAVNETGVWEYYADMPVTKEGGTGRLLVDVVTGRGKEGDECELAQTFWGMAGKCEVVEVGDKRVGFVRQPTGDDRFDQWASYQHPDGTVVHVAQARLRVDTVGLRPLVEQPFSKGELAELATDGRFLPR